MRVNNLGLDYLAGPGIESRAVHVRSPKANAHRVKPPGQRTAGRRTRKYIASGADSSMDKRYRRSIISYVK